MFHKLLNKTWKHSKRLSQANKNAYEVSLLAHSLTITCIYYLLSAIYCLLTLLLLSLSLSLQEYKQLLCEEHRREGGGGAGVFVTEREVRATSVFQAGEATGRALLHTLRALRRLRLVRSRGETTYLLLSPPLPLPCPDSEVRDSGSGLKT